jgi:hypothetical protein
LDTDKQFDYYMLGPECFFALVFLIANVHGHILIDRKKHGWFLWNVILRCFVELFKIYKTVCTVLKKDLALRDYLVPAEQD